MKISINKKKKQRQNSFYYKQLKFIISEQNILNYIYCNIFINTWSFNSNLFIT